MNARELKTCKLPGCTQPIGRNSRDFCSQSCAAKARSARGLCKRAGCTNPTRKGRSYCSRPCYDTDRWELSLKKRVLDQGLNYGTVLLARMENRSAEIDGAIKVYSPRRCWSCLRALGIIGGNRLCEPCKASGLRWCSSGKHVVGLDAYVTSSHSCREHTNERTRRSHMARRGVAVDPPDGFDPVPVVARRVGYSCGHVRKAIRTKTWLQPEDVWQRCPRGEYFIRRMDCYPPLPKLAKGV